MPVTKTIGFFPLQILIFRMLRNNADVRRYSYVELRLLVEKRAQKFYTDDPSLPRYGLCFCSIVRGGGILLQSIRSTSYLNLCSDTSSLWIFCMGSRVTDVISREIGGSVGKMSSVFSG